MTASAADQPNDNLVLIGGDSGSGKSAALANLRKPEGVLYLNCESGKKLPFRNKFIKKTITDPYQIYEGFNWAETQPDVHTIVIDTATFLMEMFESIHVLPSSNTMKAWGDYAQFWKNLMQQYVAKSTKNIIILTHIAETLDENTGIRKVQAPVKGSLKLAGIEAFFSLNVTACKMPIRLLEDYKNPYLNITEDDKLVGYKHVFQTRVTKETTGSRIRGPMGMFKATETYIDNDAQVLMDIIHEFYKDE